MSPFNYAAFYDGIAPLYEFGQRSLPIWRRYTEAVLPWVAEEGTILEIGPGPGLLLQRLARPGRTVIGLDLSWGMLAQCRSRLQAGSIRAGLVQAQADYLPLDAASVDTVILTFVFSAIPDGLRAMAEIARVLRPGGTVALVDAGEPTDGNLGGRLLARAWERFGDFMRDEARIMAQAGLEILVNREFGAFHSIRLVVGRRPNGRGE